MSTHQDTFTLKIETGNAAFEEAGGELARILRELADWLETDCGEFAVQGTVRDINGNTVGRWDR